MHDWPLRRLMFVSSPWFWSIVPISMTYLSVASGLPRMWMYASGPSGRKSVNWSKMLRYTFGYYYADGWNHNMTLYIFSYTMLLPWFYCTHYCKNHHFAQRLHFYFLGRFMYWPSDSLTWWGSLYGKLRKKHTFIDRTIKVRVFRPPLSPF